MVKESAVMMAVAPPSSRRNRRSELRHSEQNLLKE
jgi:hypothetical protein